jgi:hypothetical protein
LKAGEVKSASIELRSGAKGADMKATASVEQSKERRLWEIGTSFPNLSSNLLLGLTACANGA